MNISGCITTLTMEVLGLYLVLALFAGKQFAEGQSIYNLRCIPPMIDFEAKFANTLRLRPEFRRTIEEIKRRRFAPPGCQRFDSTAVDNVWALNVQRCTQGTPIEFPCITTTTSTTTTTTTTQPPTTTTTQADPTTTTDSFIVPWRSTTDEDVVGIPSPATVSTPQVTYRTSKTPPYIPPPSPSDSGGGTASTTTMYPKDQDTTSAYIPGPGVTGVIPTVEAVVSKESNITTTVISVCAGILGLLLIIGLLFFCRKNLCAGSGAINAHLNHEKVQRQRSDCQPISAINPNLDTYDPFDPASPNVNPVYGGYNRGFVTNGRKWRPDGSVNSMGADTVSEAGSTKSGASGVPGSSRYIILREDSASSAYNFNLHYNTLRAIDHPHALTTGGFGESSTDATLPRAKWKKHNRSGDVAETDFCYAIDKSSRNSSRYASRESMASAGSDMFGSRTSIKSIGSLKNGGPVPNGIVIPGSNGTDHVTGNSHRLFKKNSSRGNSRKNSVDFDSHSQGTIDEADQGLDVSTRSAHVHANPAFRGEDEIIVNDPVFVESEERFRGEADPASVDSIVSKKNIDMFSYDNHAMENGSLPRGRPKGKNGYVDPPAPFRDPNEQLVAVVQPVKGDPRKSGTIDKSDKRNDSKSNNKDSSYLRSTANTKPSRPTKNGSIPVAATPPYSHNPSPTSTATKSNRSPTSNGKVPNGKISNGHTPNGKTSNGHIPNGKTSNGHIPNGKITNGHTPNGKLPNDLPKPKSSFLYGQTNYSHTNGHQEPPVDTSSSLQKLADVRL